MADEKLNSDLDRLSASANLANEQLQKMADELSSKEAVAKPSKKTPDDASKVGKVWVTLKNGAKMTKEAADQAAGGVRDFVREADSTGDAMGAMANMVDGMVDAVGELGESGEKAADVLGKFSDGAKFFLDALVEQKKAYQDLSKSGLTAADGMAGTQRMFIQSKMSQENFNKTMKSASEGIALFSGTASKGSDDFSKVLGDLTQGDMTLRRLGMTQEEMGDTAATYLKILSITGTGQQRSMGDLSKQTKDYAQQIDLIARLTGQSREAIAKQQAADIEDNDRLMAVMQENADQSDLIRDTFTTLKNELGDSMAQGYLDTISGNASDLALLFNKQTGLRQENLKNWKSIDQARKDVQKGMQQNLGMIQSSAFLTEGGDVGDDFARKQAFINKDLDGYQRAVADQTDALNAKNESTDDMLTAEQKFELMQNKWNEAIIGFLPGFADLNNDVASGFKKVAELIGGAMPSGDTVQQTYDSFKGAIGLGTGMGPSSGGGDSLLKKAESMKGMNEGNAKDQLTSYMNQYSGTVVNDISDPKFGAWCARYVNSTLQSMGLKGTKNALASSFDTYGEGIWKRGQGMDFSGVKAGDIAVFDRAQGSGHVAFIKDIDPKTGTVTVVGGNQGGAKESGGGVTETKMKLSELRNIRRAPGVEQLPPTLGTQVASTEIEKKEAELKIAKMDEVTQKPKPDLTEPEKKVSKMTPEKIAELEAWKKMTPEQQKAEVQRKVDEELKAHDEETARKREEGIKSAAADAQRQVDAMKAEMQKSLPSIPNSLGKMSKEEVQAYIDNTKKSLGVTEDVKTTVETTPEQVAAMRADLDKIEVAQSKATDKTLNEKDRNSARAERNKLMDDYKRKWESPTEQTEVVAKKPTETPPIMAATPKTETAEQPKGSTPPQASASNLTVPSSNYAQSSVPRPDQLEPEAKTGPTSTQPLSFDDTIALMRDVSVKIDRLRRTTEQQLASTTTAKQKARA